MKNIKSKAPTIFVLCILIILNSIILFSYYNFYLSDKITTDIIEAKNKNYLVLNNITRKIYGKTLDEIVYIIDYEVKENGGYISLKEKDGKVLYTNKKDINKLFSSTVVLLIGASEYELTYSNILITPGLELIKKFVIFEIILISFLSIIIFFVNNRQVIDPIDIITKDITEYKYGIIPMKKNLPKKMEKIQNSFVDMVESLEVEKEHQNQIIASISHDIKTPLTSVIGYTDRLKNNELDEEKRKKYIDKIYSKAILMKEILEEFDDYQSCNIKETMKFENILISDLVTMLENDYKDELKDKKITLNINSNCNDKKINVDITKIKRVFGNIITNSVTNFKGKEGIINIDFSYINNKIKIEIADNGGGISNEKDLKKIFEPLYTTDPSRKISGLGLSICKQIISAHDGVIYAKNNNIGGLSIIFKLPKY